MPKPKPDQVIRHEIILGSVERKLLDEATTAYQVNKISTPIVALLSDVSAMTTIFSVIAVYFGFKYEIPQGLYGDVVDLAGDFQEQYIRARKQAALFPDKAEHAFWESQDQGDLLNNILAMVNPAFWVMNKYRPE